MLDIFRSDAFSVVALTDAINNLKFKPGFVSASGLFSESSISTTTVVIESKNNILVLVPPTPRGAPGVTMPKARRDLRALPVPHFEINDAIMAEEVQGVRPFGEETGTTSVMQKVGERMQEAGQSLEYTLEYARVGAIKGVVTYADGSTLDLFREYGIAVPANIDFNLDAAAPGTGSVRKQLAGLIRTMGANLDGIGFSGVDALCGDAFFDELIMNPEVRATYLNTQAAAELRQGYVQGGQVWGSFSFGGVNFTNYRGNNGAVPFIDTNTAYFYPTGVPGLFRTYVAPADYVETVNTMGVMRYTKQYNMPNDKGVHMDTQMNVLNICTRPLALLRGVRT
jgi:hypothetical protein